MDATRIFGLTAGGLVLVGMLTAAAAPPPAQTSVTKYPGGLLSVGGASPSDVWAPGFAQNTGTFLMAHWNGTNWTRAALPGKGLSLDSVSVESASDAWAVGDRSGGSGGVDGLNVALHWNGTAWTQVPVPSPHGTGSPFSDGLTGVSADSPADAWAVGHSTVNANDSAVVLHWNGTSWAQVAVPSPAGDELLAVKALSPADVWAFGEAFPSERMLILHWDGTSWTQAATPKGIGFVNAVSALSPTDAWAVGECCGLHANQSLVLHWDGTAWTRQPSPSPAGLADGSSNVLAGVSALSGTNAWAVGDDSRGRSQVPLILHFDGTSWSQVASPSFGPGSALDSVQALSATDAWAVGSVFLSAGRDRTLILHWDGTAWTRS